MLPSSLRVGVPTKVIRLVRKRFLSRTPGVKRVGVGAGAPLWIHSGRTDTRYPRLYPASLALQ